MKMKYCNSNNIDNRPSNEPNIEVRPNDNRRDISVDIPDEEMDMINELQDDELDLEISIDDSSVIWDLRQLFDLDFLARDISPFPRGDSADIPNEIMRIVTPVLGDGCPDENNMNIRNQQNQNNMQGESKRSNTCLKNLTRAIHDSDQVKDILFGTASKPKPQPVNNNDSCSSNNKPEEKPPIIVERTGSNSNLRSRYGGSQRENNNRLKTRRSRYDDSSSSESSSDSSCSCSNRKHRNYGHCHQQVCHCNQNACHSQCGNITQTNNKFLPTANTNNTINEQNPNQGHPNGNQMMPSYSNYLIPNPPWQASYGPQMEYSSDIYASHYPAPSMIPPFVESYNCPQPDMSDIIARIQKLDISISNLTKNTCNCQSRTNQPSKPFDTYNNNYFVNH